MATSRNVGCFLRLSLSLYDVISFLWQGYFGACGALLELMTRMKADEDAELTN